MWEDNSLGIFPRKTHPNPAFLPKILPNVSQYETSFLQVSFFVWTFVVAYVKARSFADNDRKKKRSKRKIKASLFIMILCVPWRRMRDLHGYRPSVMPIITPAIAATVTKRRIEAGDTRRRQLIFKEVYASLKAQLSHRERNGSGTRAERGQVLTK